MDKLFFNIDYETPIYLYGAASIGKIVLKNLSAYNLLGFIDMRGKEIQSMCGKPVCSLDDMTSLIGKDAVIIITVKNVFEHEEIAYLLYKYGYKNLVYKPKGTLEGNTSNYEEILSNLWDKIVSSEIKPENKNIPQYQPVFNYKFMDYAKISETNDRIIANVPLELIYTNDTEGFWGNINIQALYPHISFFNFLSNKRGAEKESYIKFCEQSASTIGDIKITEAWKENVLRNRTRIYERMSNALDLDPDFFIRSAPTATWNKKGYFNLTSGKHRATFLTAKGRRYIPLSIASSDYFLWLQNEEYIKLKELIIRNGEREIAYKVFHPYFYQFPCTEKNFYTQFQVNILCFLCKKSKLQKRIIKVAINLSEKNSIYDLLDKCTFVEIVKEQADIQLIDQFSTELMSATSDESLVITNEEKKGDLLCKYIDNGKVVKLYFIRREI